MHLIILAFLVLVGCAGPMLLAKDGATEKDLQHDHYDCRHQFDSSAQGLLLRQDPVAHLYELTEARNYMQACMERKGWGVVKYTHQEIKETP